MSRRNAAATVIVLTTLAAVLGGAGCSKPSCKPGTLLLHIALLDDAPLADTVTVMGQDPGAAVDETFPHTPDPSGANISVEHFDVNVTWPLGYPTNAEVTLTARALAGGTQLGIGNTRVRLTPGCTTSGVLVSNRDVELGDDGGSGSD